MICIIVIMKILIRVVLLFTVNCLRIKFFGVPLNLSISDDFHFKVSLHFIFKNCTCFKILSLCNPYQCRFCASKCFVLKALTMVLPSLNFCRDYLWILLKTTIIVNSYFLSLFHFEYLCMSTRSAVQVLFIAYVFVTFDWS